MSKKIDIRSMFESDIISLADKMQDDSYANAFYASICNIIWAKHKLDDAYSCSWRYAGGLVAQLRDKGEDYLDFYCAGQEGRIRTDVLEDMQKLGWKPKGYGCEEIETYLKK